MYSKLFLNIFIAPGSIPKYKNSINWLAFGLRSLSVKSNDGFKNPRTPFLIFSNDKMSQVRKSNPGLKITELSKLLGEMWRNLSENEKEVFRNKYKEEKENFDKVNPGAKALKLEERREKRLKKKLKKLKSLRKENGKPMPSGTNPYLLFATSKMVERGDASMQMYVQGVSDMWKKMPDEDKKPFVDMARKNSLQYKKDLWKWEQSMIKSGQEKLLSPLKLKKHLAKSKSKAVPKKNTPKDKSF